MAKDKELSGGYLSTSNYAELHRDGRTVRVRGSAYDEFSSNYFEPRDARDLAHYILELADDAERDPELDALEEDLSAAFKAASVMTTTFSGGGVTVVAGGGAGGSGSCGSTPPVGRIAEKLYKMGYRKS